MVKPSPFLLLVALIFISILANAPTGTAVTCSDVNIHLFSCLSYVTGGGNVPSACCSGLKTLVDLAKTKLDRQTACSCLKSLAANASDDQIQRTATIPVICGVQIPFIISRDVDCSKVIFYFVQFYFFWLSNFIQFFFSCLRPFNWC